MHYLIPYLYFGILCFTPCEETHVDIPVPANLSATNYVTEVFWKTDSMTNCWWGTNQPVFTAGMAVGAPEDEYQMHVRVWSSNHSIVFFTNLIIRVHGERTASLKLKALLKQYGIAI